MSFQSINRCHFNYHPIPYMPVYEKKVLINGLGSISNNLLYLFIFSLFSLFYTFTCVYIWTLKNVFLKTILTAVLTCYFNIKLSWILKELFFIFVQYCFRAKGCCSCCYLMFYSINKYSKKFLMYCHHTTYLCFRKCVLLKVEN